MHWLGLSLKIKSADRLAYKLGRKFVYNFRFRRLIHFNLSSNSAVLTVNTLNMSTNIRTAELLERLKWINLRKRQNRRISFPYAPNTLKTLLYTGFFARIFFVFISTTETNLIYELSLWS
jgi:hypothetical protein